MALIDNNPVPNHIFTEMMQKKNEEILSLKQSLRDQFAMAALPALIEEGDTYKEAARHSYLYADAMLEARK